jgi:hypothetical protein
VRGRQKGSPSGPVCAPLPDRLAGFSRLVHQINGAQLPTFVANGDVAGFLREMVDLVQSEPAHLARAATSVVAERKHGLASQILAFDELLEKVTLGSFEFPRREKLLRREFDSTGRVTRDERFVDQPLSKAAEDGFHALTVADTHVCELAKQVGLHSGLGKIESRVKRQLMSWKVREPSQKLPESNRVGIPGRFSFKSEP